MLATPGPLLNACGIGRRARSAQDWLIRGICITIAPGERVAITGPSGAGKTVLLRTLALLDPLDEGVIEWRRQRVSGAAVPLFRREVIYLHQRSSLFDGNIEANLRYPFFLKVNRSRSFDKDRILRLLEIVGRTPSFLEKSCRDLSGGEVQIVALLRALQFDPSILLLDEPTASLDERTTWGIENLIRQWHSEIAAKRAFVWVTHDLDQARRVADRFLHMQHGRIEPN
jgi:putative ABC transport system ATP-binding protein